MARRRKSTSGRGALLFLLLAIAGAGIGGSFLFKRSNDPFAAITALSVPAFLENANSLRGNTYKLQGSIDERLDEWPPSEGRLYSVVVDRDGIDGGESETLPVHFPEDFNGQNIQRDQEYNLKVEVGTGGLLVAHAFDKI